MQNKIKNAIALGLALCATVTSVFSTVCYADYSNEAKAVHTLTQGTVSMEMPEPDTESNDIGSAIIQTNEILSDFEETTFLDETTANIESACDSEIKAAIRKYEEEEKARQLAAQVKSQMASRSGMYGRLYIPSVGISVAMIHCSESNAQAVTNARDSAAYILYFSGARIIADHNNQAFSKLTSVTPGMKAQILQGDKNINLTCSFAINGVNTGYNLTDGNGDASIIYKADYVAYTCMSDWHHVRIVGFNVT